LMLELTFFPSDRTAIAMADAPCLNDFYSGWRSGVAACPSAGGEMETGRQGRNC